MSFYILYLEIWLTFLQFFNATFKLKPKHVGDSGDVVPSFNGARDEELEHPVITRSAAERTGLKIKRCHPIDLRSEYGIFQAREVVNISWFPCLLAVSYNKKDGFFNHDFYVADIPFSPSYPVALRREFYIPTGFATVEQLEFTSQDRKSSSRPLGALGQELEEVENATNLAMTGVGEWFRTRLSEGSIPTSDELWAKYSASVPHEPATLSMEGGEMPSVSKDEHHMPHPCTYSEHTGGGKPWQEWPFKCDECPFKCDECPWSFGRNAYLKCHKRRIHESHERLKPDENQQLNREPADIQHWLDAQTLNFPLRNGGTRHWNEPGRKPVEAGPLLMAATIIPPLMALGNAIQTWSSAERITDTSTNDCPHVTTTQISHVQAANADPRVVPDTSSVPDSPTANSGTSAFPDKTQQTAASPGQFTMALPDSFMAREIGLVSIRIESLSISQLSNPQDRTADALETLSHSDDETDRSSEYTSEHLGRLQEIVDFIDSQDMTQSAGTDKHWDPTSHSAQPSRSEGSRPPPPAGDSGRKRRRIADERQVSRGKLKAVSPRFACPYQVYEPWRTCLIQGARNPIGGCDGISRLK